MPRASVPYVQSQWAILVHGGSCSTGAKANQERLACASLSMQGMAPIVPAPGWRQPSNRRRASLLPAVCTSAAVPYLPCAVQDRVQLRERVLRVPAGAAGQPAQRARGLDVRGAWGRRGQGAETV